MVKTRRDEKLETKRQAQRRFPGFQVWTEIYKIHRVEFVLKHFFFTSFFSCSPF